MELTDQNHSSNPTEQGVFSYEKVPRGPTDIDSTLSEKMRALNEKMDNYYSEYKRSVKRRERNVKSLETKLEDLYKCVDRETVVNLIHEIVLILINEKDKGSSYSSESFEDPNGWVEEMDSEGPGQVIVKCH